ERYWGEAASLTPWYAWGGADIPFGETPAENIAPQTLADSLAIERRYLLSVAAVPRSSLDDQSKLTYDIFVRARSLTVEGFTYPFELLPINPFEGMPEAFALSAPGAGRVAISSPEEYQRWRARALRFVEWTNQATVNMRAGLRRGYTMPRVLIAEALPELAALGADEPANVFYDALGSDSGGTAQEARLTAGVRAVLKENVLPAYRALHDFLQREYLPRARTSVGWSALPLGNAWYAYLLRRSTGSAATPAELHMEGVAEVERLQTRVRSLLSEAAFPGDPQAFYDRMRADPRYSHKEFADLLGAYQGVKAEVQEAAPALFSAFPRAEFGIRKVDAYREPFAPAVSYAPRAPNGLTPAVLYVNASANGGRPIVVLPSQYLRDAVPGRHYQLELQRERLDLPRFRRYGGAPAFVDGWGLYAAALGEELKVYRDPEAKFGSLLVQMDCALGLVLDTGLHAQGWTRQQALDYLHAHRPMDDDDAVKTVDRMIALPGKAAACMVGFLKIEGLRTRAQQRKGAAFDVRAFHDEIVKDGAMPLDVLETKMSSWLERAEAVPAEDRPPGGAPK
ncbi:MAG TPA: DUF885 domain-containing protein, partial [Steroidobacteraceae bacterium]|nr:DUF885 domain-containing protein [Steroidobacteraceae bacterium]